MTMTEKQESVVHDLKGRGYVLLSRDYRSSSLREIKDAFLVAHDGTLFRVNREGQLHRMVPEQECRMDGSLVCSIG